MANTISVMTNAVRGVVSKKRIRYQENGYDLDLAYVTDNLIAMGYPAESIESIFRNKIDHVYHFLEEKHKDHYKIYNLCSERHYDGNKFHGRVALYPFDDHNPPPIRLIKKFCDDVDAWLKADKENVAAVHCKAGKGRTGTMICCYLLHCHMKTTAESALTFYDEKRTKNKKGVTIPSQRRYVEYYAKLVSSGQPYEERTLQILEIRFSPQLSNQDNIYCSIYPNPRSDDAESNNITLNFRKTQTIEINDRCIPLTGDVKIEVFRKVMKRREKYFHFWFNTYFICDNAAVYEDDGSEKIYYELSKYELDDAHKDTEHKTVPQDFKVQLAFKPVPKYHQTTPTSTTATIGYVANDSNSLLKVNHSNSTFGPQQNHHSHYNQLQHSNNVALNHNNAPLPSILPRPNATNNINNISDPTTMTNQRVPNATRLSSVGSSSSRSSSGDQQVHMLMSPSPSQSSAVIVDVNCCYPNQRDHHQHLDKYQSHKHQQNQLQNSNSLTNAIALTKAKDDFSPSNSEHRLSNNYKGGALARSNYQEDNIPQIANQQPLKYSVGGSDRDSLSTSTAAAELHTPSVSSDISRTNSSSRSSSINSSEVSSQSAGCGGDCGDEEEDWESGESSILSKRKETINDKTGIENENEHENDHENSMLMAMMDAEDSYSTVHVNNIHSSLVSPSSLHNLSQDSSGNDSNYSFQENTSILRNDKCRNPNLINLNLKSNSANNNNSCNNNNGNNYKTNSRCMDKNVEKTNTSNFMETTSSNGSCSNVSKLMLTEKQQCKVESLVAPAASSTGCSKLTKLANIASKTSKPAYKTLGLHNTISNNNNASKKMQKARRWLSSMKSDPDLCETLAKSVKFRKVADHPATSSSGVLIKRAAVTETDTGCNRITDTINNVSEEAGYVSGDNGRGLHYSLLNHRTRTNSTSDHDDFYSSLCDKQLSFGGSSPMKSPLNSIDRIKLRGDTIGEQILRRGKVNDNSLSEGFVVVAKPIQSCAIGFNVPSNYDHSSLPAQETEAEMDTVDAPAARYDKQLKIESEEPPRGQALTVETNVIKTNSTTQQQTSLAAPPLINSNNLLNPPTKSSSTASFQIAPNSIPVTPSIATLSTICADDPKAFALISSSPPAGKANRCTPFSFRTLRQNLDSVLKSKSTKNANSST